LREVEIGPDDPDAPTECETTESGLKFRILRKSDGPKPAPENYVRVHYKGWLDDGTVFENSYKESRASTFKVEELIKGWGEGLQLVAEGGKIELELPPELGYGDESSDSDIPPGSTLHFVVELLKVL